MTFWANVAVTETGWEITGPVDPVLVGANISVSASSVASDAPSILTAAWNWGDGNTSPGIVNEAGTSVDGSYTYTNAGCLYSYADSNIRKRELG